MRTLLTLNGHAKLWTRHSFETDLFSEPASVEPFHNVSELLELF